MSDLRRRLTSSEKARNNQDLEDEIMNDYLDEKVQKSKKEIIRNLNLM